jgi:hypothetical protein
LNILVNPLPVKECYERVSLAVSVVNDSEARVWVAIRIASVIHSLSKMVY